MMKTKAEEVKELKELLSDLDNNYYNHDVSLVSDAEYDAIKQKIIKLDGEYKYVPGEPQEEFERVEHTYPVKSLEKVNKREDLIKKIAKLLPVIIEPKFDGLTVVDYPDKYVSRGNGFLGENISKTAEKINGIKHHAKEIVRMEAYISHAEFNRLNLLREKEGLEPFSNARNAAAGMLRNKDVSKVHSIDYFAYNILGTSMTETEQLQELEKEGFRTTPHWRFTDLMEAVDFVMNFDRTELDYDIDGLVIKSDIRDASKIFSETEHHPKSSFSWKFPPKGKWTKLIDVIYQIGRTGRLTPVAMINPLEISGSIISRVTLHNETIMNTLGITKGCDVFVIKANDVIPAITEVKNIGQERFLPVTNCPECGSKLREVNGLKYCDNPLCHSRLALNVVHLAKKDSLDIEGFSLQTANKMLEQKIIKEPTDIFDLEMDDILQLEGFAQKSVKKLYIAIQKARKTSLKSFLYACGIPEIGRKASSDIASYFGSLDAFKKDIDDGLTKTSTIEGIGKIMIDNILKYCYLIEKLEKYVQPENVIKNSSATLAPKEILTFVLTGKLAKPRSEYEKLINQAGHQVASSVSKKVNFLIAGENVGATKLGKAEKLGVPIISEEQLMAKLENAQEEISVQSETPKYLEDNSERKMLVESNHGQLSFF